MCNILQQTKIKSSVLFCYYLLPITIALVNLHKAPIRCHASRSDNSVSISTQRFAARSKEVVLAMFSEWSSNIDAINNLQVPDICFRCRESWSLSRISIPSAGRRRSGLGASGKKKLAARQRSAPRVALFRQWTRMESHPVGLQHRRNALARLFDVLAAVERGNTDESLSVFSESRTGCGDNLCFVQQLVEEIP